MDKKVSIIIPVYNAEKTIKKCVTSLINGNYKNIEILLIEDCSPDLSLAACKELEKQYPEVCVTHNEKNRGVSHTRNRGLEKASGDYIVFVDGDDYADPQHIEGLVNAANNNPDRLCICGYIFHNELENAAPAPYLPLTQDEYSQKYGDTLLGLYKTSLIQSPCNKIFSREIIEQNFLRFDESLSMGEDFKFVLDYLECPKNIKPLPLEFAHYHYIRSRSDSLMSTFGKVSIDEARTDLKRLIALSSFDESAKQSVYEAENNSMTKLYSYALMHNRSLNLKQKIDAIKRLDGKNSFKNVVSSVVLLLKEKLTAFLKKQ